MSDKIEQHTRVAQRYVAVAEQHVAIAQQRLAAAREQLVLAQAQVLAAKEEVVRAQEQVTAAEDIRKLQPLVVRPDAAARALSIDRSTLYRLLASGALKSFKIGSIRLVPVRELEEFIRRKMEESA